MADSYSPRAKIPARQVAMPPAPVVTDAEGKTLLVEPPTPVGISSRPIAVAAEVTRPSTPKIAAAIAAIQAEIGIVDKGGQVGEPGRGFNFKYARIEDVLTALTPLMGKNGLAVIQDEIEITQIEKTGVAVKYEFTVIHESGEVQPAIRRTGMSNARDGRGQWDDKALNKCGTQARKYFLIGLFQIPIAEIDDNDRPPKPKRETVPARPQKQDARIAPHKIVMGAGKGPDAWLERFIAMLGQAETVQEVHDWDKRNNDAINSLKEGFDEHYNRLVDAINLRLKQFKTDSAAVAAAENIASYMPDPAKDAIAATNWVAQQLNDCQTPEALEAFWAQVIEPVQSRFAPPDYEVLLIELRRAETKLGVTQEGVADANVTEVPDQTRGDGQTPGGRRGRT
jgi:hypothetical protein